MLLVLSGYQAVGIRMRFSAGDFAAGALFRVASWKSVSSAAVNISVTYSPADSKHGDARTTIYHRL